jgi:predicted enzyme related to lactoylglutathione lyase
MDFETISSGDFGRSLSGIGLNILVRDVKAEVAFLEAVFGMKSFRVSADFAIMTYGREVLQLHSDGTFGAHPLLGLLPEAGARGAGAEFRLYETDPDEAAAKAEAAGGHVLQAPANKPHGLRECVILDADGYAWVPSRGITVDEEGT